MKTARLIATAGAIITLIGLSSCVWYDPAFRGYYGHDGGHYRGYYSPYGGRDRRDQSGDYRGRRGDGDHSPYPRR